MWILIIVAVAGAAWLIWRSRSPVKWILALTVAVLLVPLGVAALLLYTPAGVRLAQGQLERLEPFGIYVQGLSGRIAGPLRVQRFELERPQVHIVAHDVIVEPRIRQLLIQTVGIRSLKARDTLVEIKRTEPSPPPTKPLRFLPSFMRIDLDAAELSGVRYVNIDGTVVEAHSLRGEATLSPRRIRVRQFAVRGAGFEFDGRLVLRARRPLGIELTTHGRFEQREVPYVADARLGGTVDELAIQVSLQQPASVAADLMLTRPDASWRIAGAVRTAELSLQPWLPQAPFSLQGVTLDVSVDPQGIRTRGELIVPELDAQPISIDAIGRYAQRALEVERADLRLANAAAQLRTSGRVVFDGGRPTVQARAQWSHLQWPLRGEALVTSSAGSGSLQGEWPYRFDVDARIAGPSIPTAHGTANGTLGQASVVVDRFDVAALEGRMNGSGSLSWQAPRHWQIAVTALDIDPTGIDARFAGRLSAQVTAAGTGTDRNARFAASVRALRGRLRGEPIAASGDIQRSADGWTIRDTRVDFGTAKLTLDAHLGDEVRASWSLHAPELAELLPDARGALTFAGEANGATSAPHIIAEARGERLGLGAWQAQALAVDADVDLGSQRPSRLDIALKNFGGGSPLIETMTISGSGPAEDHRLRIEIVGHAADSSEALSQAELVLAGRYADAAWHATIVESEIIAGDETQRLTLVERGQLSIDAAHASLAPVCFAMDNGRLCTQGEWRRGATWEAVVSGYELPLAAFLPPAGRDARYTGRIEGRVRAFGAAGSAWQGEAGMRIIDAAIIYQPPGGQPEILNLGTGGLGARASPERIEFSFGVQAFTDTFLFTNATIARDLQRGLLRSPLVGDFRARAADANILPLVFPEIDHAAGLLTANGTVRGTLAEPQIDGRLELANGEFDSYRVNLALRDLNLIANIADNALYFNGAARAGEGSLGVNGTFRWNDGVSSGNLQLRGTDLLIADLPEYRVVASPDLNFLIDGRTIEASGTVTIPSARIQPADLTGAVQVSEDARYVGQHPAEADGRYAVRSNVRVIMGDDVRIESFGLQGRILGAVATTVRTGETPLGRGELSIAEGRYEAYGQKLDITRGKLLFESSPLSDPGLDIEARRKLESVIVGLNVRGTLQQPRLSFFSEPTMPQTQIVSYLLVGKPVDTIGGSEAAAVGSATDALAVQGGGLLASQIGRRLGLEEVAVESRTDSAGESNQQLVLGKFLSPRLFVSYGISLTESINTLKLRYTISDRWVLKMESGEHQSADIELTVER